MPKIAGLKNVKKATFSFTEKVIEKLNYIVEYHETSKSELIRRLIENEYNRVKKQQQEKNS